MLRVVTATSPLLPSNLGLVTSAVSDETTMSPEAVGTLIPPSAYSPRSTVPLMVSSYLLFCPASTEPVRSIRLLDVRLLMASPSAVVTTWALEAWLYQA